VRDDVWWYWWNCWPSLNELRWEVIFVDIGGIPLYSTHWLMVNNSTNINKNYLSTQFIEWWSTIPPISTKITSHFNSLSDGQQFHQYQQKLPLTSTHWVMVNNSTNIDIGGIVDHHSMRWSERWFCWPSLNELWW
jgi:hypothetical protein